MYSSNDILCKCGCGLGTRHQSLIDIVDFIFYNFPHELKINSWNRCLNHNKKIDGAPGSRHCFGQAVDIMPVNYLLYRNDLKRYVSELLQAPSIGIGGLGIYKNFVHIDV